LTAAAFLIILSTLSTAEDKFDGKRRDNAETQSELNICP
jgi:hypothetical protein